VGGVLKPVIKGMSFYMGLTGLGAGCWCVRGFGVHVYKGPASLVGR